MLVDLPGYGFAAVGREQSGAWTRLIALYLQGPDRACAGSACWSTPVTG